jgi:hypothetical protein
MGLAPFNRIRQLAAQESDSGHPINAQQGAGLQREMDGLRQAELNKTRVLSKEELDVLQNAHLRDPYAEGQVVVEDGTPESELIMALGSVDHSPAPVGTDVNFIEKLHEAAGKVEESKSDPESAPKRRGKASEQKPEASAG